MTGYTKLKVFSASLARERAELGARVTDWLASYAGTVVATEVRQTSDASHHCLTVLLFLQDAL